MGRKHFVVSVSLELVIYFFVAGCNSFTLPNLPGISTEKELEHVALPIPTPQMQCMHDGVYYIGNIPSPNSCHNYFSCVPSAMTPGGTYQIQMPCSTGHDGQKMIYDAKNCQFGCRTLEEGAECYDEDTHWDLFYNCSVPYHPSEWP